MYTDNSCDVFLVGDDMVYLSKRDGRIGIVIRQFEDAVLGFSPTRLIDKKTPVVLFYTRTRNPNMRDSALSRMASRGVLMSENSTYWNPKCMQHNYVNIEEDLELNMDEVARESLFLYRVSHRFQVSNVERIAKSMARVSREEASYVVMRDRLAVVVADMTNRQKGNTPTLFMGMLASTSQNAFSGYMLTVGDMMLGIRKWENTSINIKRPLESWIALANRADMKCTEFTK